MNKRRFLAMAGAGVVLAGGAAGVGLSLGGEPKSLAAWRVPDAGDADPRRRALSYAVLAPSAHNMQPWLIDLSVENEIALYFDEDAKLPAADPMDRQSTIGLGAFLELLVMAAGADGYRADVVLFPEGSDEAALSDRPVARVSMTADASLRPDPLFAFVKQRRSTKEPYDLNRPVAKETLDALTAAISYGSSAGATNDPAMVAKLRQFTTDAIDVENSTAAYAETVSHYRLGRKEIEASPDGIDIGGLFFEALILFGQFSREQALDTKSSVFASGRDTQLKQANTAMGHVWVTTAGNSRERQIAAGRDWVRINLAATELGLAIHPLSQVLEEMREMAELRTKAHALLAPDGDTVQMLARVGYAAVSDPSPRWALATKIKDGSA